MSSGNGAVATKQRRSWLPVGVTLVALVMIVGFTFFVTGLMGTIEELDGALRSAHAGIDARTRMLQIVAAKETEIVHLFPASANGDVSGTLFLNTMGNIALVWNRDTLAGNYVLWSVQGHDTTKLGVLDRQGGTFWVLDGFQPVDAEGIFQVSREPHGDTTIAGGQVMLTSR